MQPAHQVGLGCEPLFDAGELLGDARRVAALVIVDVFELGDAAGVVIDLFEQDGGTPDDDGELEQQPGDQRDGEPNRR